MMLIDRVYLRCPIQWMLTCAMVLASASAVATQPTEAVVGYLADIGAISQLDFPGDGEPVVIAVVDDGVRATHQDVADFIWTNPGEIPANGIDDDGNGHVDDTHGWDVSDDDLDIAPPAGRPDYYHGTYLSSIVTRIVRQAFPAAASEQVRIMPVKVIGDGAESSYLIDGFAGIDYAIDAGADIILAAWTVGAITDEQSKILQRASDRGILVVASAGNFPEQREQYPAAHDAVLAVAALDRAGDKLENANFGQFVDLSAPGESIEAASHATDTAYETHDGSSPAAAMVAATLALVKRVHPDLTPIEIEACLKSGADPIESRDSEMQGKLGAGKLNISAAVQCRVVTEGIADAAPSRLPQGYLRPPSRSGSSVSWTIEPPGTFNGIRFIPIFPDGAGSGGELEFRARPDSPVLFAYTLGEVPERRLFVPGSRAHVTFTPHRRRDDQRWLLAYEADTIRFSQRYCKGMHNIRVPGVLTDGSGDEPYAHNSDCKWLITAPQGKVIEFDFIEFNTEPRRDMIYFFDGTGTHEKIMAIFSGPNTPPRLKTWRNQVLVWFVTDGEHAFDGWRVEYQFVSP